MLVEPTNMTPKNTICLWYDKDALDAAQFYAATFPNSEVTRPQSPERLPRVAGRAMS